MTGSSAIAFPGQGGEWRAACSILAGAADHHLVRALAERLGTDRLDDLDGLDTRIAQPVVYVAGLVGPASGIDHHAASLAMGHSLGEITAAAWAGAMDHEDGLDLVVARGELGHAAQSSRPGAMAAINRWPLGEVEWLRRQVQALGHGTLDIAVRNSATQVVVSGDVEAVHAAVERANHGGAVARLLPIGGAYHSSLMVGAVEAFRERAAAITGTPQVPVLSSTTQRSMATAEDLVEGLTRSLVLPVDWPATVAAAAEAGVARALEAGPGDTLARLARFAPQLAIVAP